MKTRLLMIITLTFPLLFLTQLVYAPPGVNPDWQGNPYCVGGRCSMDFYKEGWAKYYDIKGSEWMETKKQEMFAAIENGTLDEWLDEPTMAHDNVRTYYFYQGEVPNHDGKFVDQVSIERDLRDIENNLRNNQLPVGGIYMNFTALVIIIGGISTGIIFVIRRKRK